MSTFEPGEGWRRVGDEEPYVSFEGRERLVHVFPNGDSRIAAVREEPVPALPTEPYTVIRVDWKEDERLSGDVLMLRDGAWYLNARALAPDDVFARITGFEVLAYATTVTETHAVVERVRRETAKAVLDRVMITGISGDAVGALYRQFGVES